MDRFKNFQADQPFFVGSHAQASTLIAALVSNGIGTFVLDIPPQEEEFANVAQAFTRARELLAG